MPANDTIEALKEGDIYRWYYRDPSTDNRAYGTYHCCSRIAVVERGRLRDTYWSSGSDGRSFGPDDIPKLELKFVGNFSELHSAMEYEADYYDDADLVDLNHANSTRGNFYLRKGAVRSQRKMLAVARRSLEFSLAAERSASHRSEELRKTISQIEAGEISVFIPSPPRS
jgi:hypothetical protein